MKKTNYIIACTYLLFLSLCFSNQEASTENISTNGTKYFLGDDGMIHIYVNVWGHVNSPGRVMINEGTDIATILSAAGGPKSGADLANIKIYRESKDKEGNVVYTVNFKKFIDDGDKSDFIEIKPNDTIMIPQSTSSYFLESISTVNTILSLVNLILLMSSSN